MDQRRTDREQILHKIIKKNQKPVNAKKYLTVAVTRCVGLMHFFLYFEISFCDVFERNSQMGDPEEL